MNYWLDLFTGTTWREFRNAGANVSGFSAKRRSVAQRVKKGDILVCYLTGIMRWIGALKVGEPSSETKRIWKDQEFPVRFNVKPLIMLEPEHGVPMDQLEGRVGFFESAKDKGKFRGFVRASPNLFQNPKDAELILSLLQDAVDNPISRPVDPKKLARKPLYKVEPKPGKQVTLVSVPEPEETPVAATAEAQEATEPSTTRHTEIQHHLLTLGAELGLDVWVARNDRGRKWNGATLGSLPAMLDRLPTQFNEATTRARVLEIDQLAAATSAVMLCISRKSCLTCNSVSLHRRTHSLHRTEVRNRRWVNVVRQGLNWPRLFDIQKATSRQISLPIVYPIVGAPDIFSPIRT